MDEMKEGEREIRILSLRGKRREREPTCVCVCTNEATNCGSGKRGRNPTGGKPSQWKEKEKEEGEMKKMETEARESRGGRERELEIWSEHIGSLLRTLHYVLLAAANVCPGQRQVYQTHEVQS